MSAEITRLANGLTVVTETMPHLETSARSGCGWMPGRGMSATTSTGSRISSNTWPSRARRRGRPRTSPRKSRRSAANSTPLPGWRSTAYFARVLKGDEGVALGIVADILQNSTFADDELEKEREVILQEIAGTLDSPDDIAFDLVHDAAFPDQPAGRTILGTPKSVKSISSNNLKDFLAERYHPKGMVLAGGRRDPPRRCRPPR